MFGNLFESFALQDRFVRSLKVIEAKNPTAKKQGKSECCRSGVCCWRRPGSLSKADVAPIAAKLGISEIELFKSLLVVDKIKGLLTLLPKRKHQKGGEMIGWQETYSLESPCVFLGKDNACEVHEVKPKTCREYRCWEENRSAITEEWKEADLKAMGWDGTDPDNYDPDNCNYESED